MENTWTIVSTRKKRLKQIDDESNNSDSQEEKISEPCWFFNNGGCKHKDSTEKTSDECRYLHVYSDNVKRPPHLGNKKPCDKFNLEGDCKWNENCKYSHRNLSPDEWCIYYPNLPYNFKVNTQKCLLELEIADIKGRMKVIEYKQDCMSKDIQTILNSIKQLQLRPFPDTSYFSLPFFAQKIPECT